MKLTNFSQEFPTEESCREHFRLQRESQGVICKKCGCEKHYWLKAKGQWQCTSCGFRTTLRSGTVMESSNVPFLVWYEVIAYMSFSKKTISAMEMQRQLNHPKYDTVWRLMHKIRSAMGKRDALYSLEGIVELDEGHFKKATPSGTKLKHGRGSQRMQKVTVMAESTPLEDLTTGEKGSQCRYFKMRVIDSLAKDEINTVAQQSLNERCIVLTDQSNSYVDIAKFVEGHITERSTRETTNTTLKWVHIAISNAKRTLLGIFHKIKAKYLQNYLNEICYKLNRRYFGEYLFDRVIIATAKSYW